MPFDIIGTARRNQLLYAVPPPPDDCEPGEDGTECVLRQCLYVVACYEEQPGDYATPLASSCGPSRDCEPTRVRETVRLNVVDTLPKGHDPLADLERRIKRCFALFTDGPFADLLNKAIVQDALAGAATPERHDDWCQLIGGLRILFKRYLERHPDHYNCTLEHDLNAICCPPDPRKPKQDTPNHQTQPGTPYSDYGPGIKDAVCRIVELAYAHVMACVMGELAFTCPEPAHASCVVLGTVEVENERLIRVCNCPRDYVWSFGSFWQVAMATLFGSLGCKGSDNDETKSRYEATERQGADAPHSKIDDLARKYRRCGCDGTLGEKPCCREFEPRDGCETFIRTLQQGGRAAPDLATSLLDAIGWIRCSVQHAFDPTRTDAVLLRALRGRQFTEVKNRILGDDVKVLERPLSTKCEPWGLIDALDMAGHVTATDRLVALTEQGVVVDVVKQGVQDRLTTTEHTVDVVREELKAVQAELDKLKKVLNQYRPPSSGGQQGPRGRGGKRGAPGGSTPGGTQP
jgi:hypothetical protein